MSTYCARSESRVLDALASLLLVSPLQVANSQDANFTEHRTPPGWFVRAPDPCFLGHTGPQQDPALDAVCADMDGDGDADLLINWHHLAPLELYENREGTFVLCAPQSRSGLVDLAGVPSLYAPVDETLERIRQNGAVGLYVWHPPTRRAPWLLAWKGAPGVCEHLSLELETSLSFAGQRGLDPGTVRAPDERHLQITLDDPEFRSFYVVARRIGSQFTLRLQPDEHGATPALFVGTREAPWPEPSVTLWNPDPHGMAWVHTESSPQPEIYITRGALTGLLRPPLEAKRDSYYLAVADSSDDGPRYLPAPATTLLPNYARGRRVEWVDLEGDGVLELSLANKASPNQLLVRDPKTGALRDRAEALGLDFHEGEVQVWMDLEGDGDQDLVFLERGRLWFAVRGPDGRFDRREGPALVAEEPDASDSSQNAEAAELDTRCLRVADLDDDGDLDLFALGLGAQYESRVFRHEPGAVEPFCDVSAEMGLVGRTGHQLVVLLDADGDGYEDAVSFGQRNELWHNVAGRRFEFHELDADLIPEHIHAAVVLDADGDGARDLAVMGLSRHLLRGVRARGVRGEEPTFLDVSLEAGECEPIGALVRAYTSDGRIVARRYGSVDSTALSQGLLPLHFELSSGARFVKLGVIWPGETRERVQDLDPAARHRTLER